MISFVDIPVTDDCINDNSYGNICVHCNCCGRYGKETQKEAQIKYYTECLAEEENFSDWFDNADLRKFQKRTVKENIKFYKQKLQELKEGMK